MKTFRKKLNKKQPQKSRKYKPLKNNVKRERLGAGPPDYYNDLSPLEQVEKVLKLVKDSTIDEIVINNKTRRPLVINTTTLSKLTYWNKHQLMMHNGLGNKDDMKNIVYMLKHDSTEYKTSNKNTLKKHINEAIGKDNYMMTFQDTSYRVPIMKLTQKTNIKMKDMIIALLENRIEIIKLMNKQAAAESKKVAESKKAAESKGTAEANTRAENFKIKRRSTPNNWEKNLDNSNKNN